MTKRTLVGWAVGLAGALAMSSLGLASEPKRSVLEQAVHTQTPYVLSVEQVEKLSGMYSLLEQRWRLSITRQNPFTFTEEMVKKFRTETPESAWNITKTSRIGFYCSAACDLYANRPENNPEGVSRETGIFIAQALQVEDRKNLGQYTRWTKERDDALQDQPAVKKTCAVLLTKEDVEVAVGTVHEGSGGSREFWDYIRKVREAGFQEGYRTRGCPKAQ